jgi:hypothetical protein
MVKPWPLPWRNMVIPRESTMVHIAQRKMPLPPPERYLRWCSSGGPGQVGSPGSRISICRETAVRKNELLSLSQSSSSAVQAMSHKSRASLEDMKDDVNLQVRSGGLMIVAKTAALWCTQSCCPSHHHQPRRTGNSNRANFGPIMKWIMINFASLIYLFFPPQLLHALEPSFSYLLFL